MNARELLDGIEARGGVASVKRDGGAAVLNVSPRSLALELLPDLQKFKPAILDLLDATGDGDNAPTASPMPQQSPETVLLPSPEASAPNSAQNSARSPQRRFIAFCDADARRRVRPELARRMQPRDVLELGRLLLALDAGLEIE